MNQGCGNVDPQIKFQELYSHSMLKTIYNQTTFEKRCRDVKTQKACEQGLDVNVVNKPLPYNPYISTYTTIKQNTKSCTYCM